jgi:hypothetical protein
MLIMFGLNGGFSKDFGDSWDILVSACGLTTARPPALRVRPKSHSPPTKIELES